MLHLLAGAELIGAHPPGFGFPQSQLTHHAGEAAVRDSQLVFLLQEFLDAGHVTPTSGIELPHRRNGLLVAGGPSSRFFLLCPRSRRLTVLRERLSRRLI